MIEIKQNLVNEANYSLKCPYSMNPIGICIHNTANDASAAAEVSYMRNNKTNTSFHFAVDELGAVQGLPLDRNGWHAGDGGNGEGNRKYIAIEICYSKSGGEKFDKGEENAAELTAYLLKQHGWGIECVKKHQDFSGKYCPHRTLDKGWDRFLSIIKTKLNMSTELYKGLDLNNKDSMRVAVDVWYEVVKENKYIKTEDSQKLLDALKTEMQGKLDIAISQASNMSTNIMGIAVALGLPNDASIEDILKRAKDLVDQSNVPEPIPSTPSSTVPDVVTIGGESWGVKELVLSKI